MQQTKEVRNDRLDLKATEERSPQSQGQRPRLHAPKRFAPDILGPIDRDPIAQRLDQVLWVVEEIVVEQSRNSHRQVDGNKTQRVLARRWQRSGWSEGTATTENTEWGTESTEKGRLPRESKRSGWRGDGTTENTEWETENTEKGRLRENPSGAAGGVNGTMKDSERKLLCALRPQLCVLCGSVPLQPLRFDSLEKNFSVLTNLRFL